MWYGSRTRCRSATTSALVEHVAEPGARHRERLRERAHDRDVRVLGDERRGAVAAELDVGLVDDDERASCGAASEATASSGCALPVGLLGEHTNTTFGRGGERLVDRGAVERERRRRVAAGTAVCVSHDRRECSRYVGSNTTAVCPGPP